jgi:hypothetical protein
MKHRHLLLVCAWLPTLAPAQSVSVSPIGESTERHLGTVLPWTQEPQSLLRPSGDKLEVREVLTEEQTVKLKNVPPIR